MGRQAVWYCEGSANKLVKMAEGIYVVSAAKLSRTV